jgi:hypothetical protein
MKTLPKQLNLERELFTAQEFMLLAQTQWLTYGIELTRRQSNA